MTQHICATCRHARPHGVGYVECMIATKEFGTGVQFFCQDGAPCYFPRGWAPLPPARYVKPAGW